jgi:DNA repair protein RecO (recombination protein O)
MGLTLATPAVVLRSWPYGESDKIVCFFTETHGKVRGIAKGAKRSRKRFANSLEAFSIVNLRFQDRPHSGLAFLLSADLIFTLKQLDSSLEKITVASYLVEIVDGLMGDRDANALVFQHLKNGLLFLDRDGAAPLEFVTFFELKLLRLAGYEPALDGCKRCARRRDQPVGPCWYFSPVAGGLLCGLCATSARENLPLGMAALTALENLQQENCAASVNGPARERIPAAVLMEIRSIMQGFLHFHMEREIRSAAFLSKFVAL